MSRKVWRTQEGPQKNWGSRDDSPPKGDMRDSTENSKEPGALTHRVDHSTCGFYSLPYVLLCPVTDRQQVAEITTWWPKSYRVLFTTLILSN